jgi:Flp pilus assembly protein TadG
MKDLFDKTFFRFTIGFVLIIAASFAVMAFSGYYQDSINASVAGQDTGGTTP